MGNCCGQDLITKVIYLPKYNYKKWGDLKYTHETDSCFDIRAVLEFQQCLKIYPRQMPNIIDTGVKFQIPEGYEMVIRPRSGLSKKGLLVHFGTIDQDYRGEIKVCVSNVSDEIIRIENGDRIAQIAIQKKYQTKFEKVESFDNKTIRGETGFGDSGLK